MEPKEWVFYTFFQVKFFQGWWYVFPYKGFKLPSGSAKLHDWKLRFFFIVP